MESKSVFNFSSAIGNKAPLSPWLIFHVHGGGFVAQSRCILPANCHNFSTSSPVQRSVLCSKSHESYLLTWSRTSGGVPGGITFALHTRTGTRPD
jgi:hypothetical protein